MIDNPNLSHGHNPRYRQGIIEFQTCLQEDVLRLLHAVDVRTQSWATVEYYVTGATNEFLAVTAHFPGGSSYRVEVFHSGQSPWSFRIATFEYVTDTKAVASFIAQTINTRREELQ